MYLPLGMIQSTGVPASITQQLDKYTKMEKTSLLELAVWRASCLWFDGSRNFDTMQDILDTWAMDESFDPTAYKNERRFTSNVAVIVQGVIQYLNDYSNVYSHIKVAAVVGVWQKSFMDVEEYLTLQLCVWWNIPDN